MFGTGGLIELHHVDEFIELASEIGVILLFGPSTDPASIPPVLGWAVLLAVVTASTKIAGWRGCRAGRGVPLQTCSRWIRARARGEFSIASIGYGHARPDNGLAPAITAGVFPADPRA
ncbi:hypothetical protein ABZ412_04375 [Nocardia sp. NPDC005746]|uniref:hypothetical protein n=1 Tax=Nocardia sp. NPDC005746 TaxID=3157062 RepID=UPI00340A22CC